MVSQWYHRVMAMTLRLTEEETEALRARAEREGRSMQDVARAAIRDYVAGREGRLQEAIARIKNEDAELLERLGR
jgi:plasmid stability protein